MKKSSMLGLCFAVFCVVLSAAHTVSATADGAHAAVACTECHATQPVEGVSVDFVGGDGINVCNKCHNPSASKSASIGTMSISAAAIVNRHASSGMIPEAMKQWMIQWYTERGIPYGDPSTTWYYGCSTCHSVHRAQYPMLLRYDMENGELCSLCHGGMYNTAPDWIYSTSRRVVYGPAHLGLLEADGATETPVPAFPKDGDVVSSTVNFPLAVFSGLHRTPANIAYRISIPGSVFNVRDVSPANNMLWYIGYDMATWDTTLEANGPYTVIITPYNPATMTDANPVSFTVYVQNQTLADKVCTLADKIRSAGIQNQGIENSLISKAVNACNAAQSGNWNAAAGILGAFKNAVEAQRGKSITDSAATMLITFVDQLLVQFPL